MKAKGSVSHTSKEDRVSEEVCDDGPTDGTDEVLSAVMEEVPNDVPTVASDGTRRNSATPYHFPLIQTVIVGLLGIWIFFALVGYDLWFKRDVRIQVKHSETTSLAADIFLWGANLEESSGLEMKTEGSCYPIPIRWQPTEVEGGLRYTIPLRDPCKRSHFKWKFQQSVLFGISSWKPERVFSTTLEGITEMELVDTVFAPDPVTNLRQHQTDMLRWKKSLCAEKYVVRVMGNPIKEFETTTNWIQLNLPDHCEEIPVEVEAYSGDQGSPAVPALFNPCASEKDEDGEPASWVKASSLLSKKEQQKKPCAPFASSEQFDGITVIKYIIIFLVSIIMIVVIRDFVTYPEHSRPAIPTILTSMIRSEKSFQKMVQCIALQCVTLDIQDGGSV